MLVGARERQARVCRGSAYNPVDPGLNGEGRGDRRKLAELEPKLADIVPGRNP